MGFVERFFVEPLAKSCAEVVRETLPWSEASVDTVDVFRPKLFDPGGVVERLAASPLAWRLDLHPHGSRWDSGAGASKVGGRWNPVGYPVVYCSADPATAILEVAVHKGFAVLDTLPHVLTRARILDLTDVHVVMPGDVPNPGWLTPGSPSGGQQAFGRALLDEHRFVVIPSTVTGESWNLLFNPARAAGRYELDTQSRFALDTRLNPPAR